MDKIKFDKNITDDQLDNVHGGVVNKSPINYSICIHPDVSATDILAGYCKYFVPSSNEASTTSSCDCCKFYNNGF